MPEQTYVPCPHCGHPYPMTPMQKELYRGRTLACNNCAKTFSADELTPALMEPRPAWSPFAPRPAESTAAASAPAGTHSGADPVAAPHVRRRSGGWGGTLATVGGAVLVVGVLLALLVPPLNRAREQANRTKCMANMRQLGAAMMIYASVNAGRFPDRIDRLLSYVQSDTLVCPSAGHTPATGQTPQIQAADLAKGGHLSYVYVGDTYSTKSNADASVTIVLYEPLTDHNGDGVDVLYADGHVAYLPKAMALVAIPTLQTATPNPTTQATAPVMPPATAPATAPTTTP